MKKIKIFLALIFSLACMFSLVACGGNNGYYVEDSLHTNVSYYSWGEAAASVEFQVYLPDSGNYEISYTLEMFYKGEKISEEAFTKTRSTRGNEIAEISNYWEVDYSATGAAGYNFKVQLNKILIKSKFGSGSAHVGLAIGFGVVGGLITVGLVVLYILLKKKDDKKQAK